MLCLKKNKTLFRASHWSITFSLSITSYLPFSHVPEGLLWDTHAPEFWHIQSSSLFVSLLDRTWEHSVEAHPFRLCRSVWAIWCGTWVCFDISEVTGWVKQQHELWQDALTSLAQSMESGFSEEMGIVRVLVFALGSSDCYKCLDAFTVSIKGFNAERVLYLFSSHFCHLDLDL